MSARFPLRRFLRGALVPLAFVCSLAAAAPLQTVRPGTLLVGSDLTYPPYAYLEAGKPAGFDAEFARLLARHLKLEPVFLDTRFPDLILGMKARRFDVVASALYVTPDRVKQVDFVPYLKTGASLLVAKGSAFLPKTPQDLCGKRVGSIKGASWTPKLRAVSQDTCKAAGRGEIAILEFPTSPEATSALMSKAVDVQIEDAAVAQGIPKQTNGRVDISSTTLLYPIVIGLGMTKGDSGLQGALERALNDAKRSGEYGSLVKKYGLQEPTAADVANALSTTK
ncbi:bacterial extracellular solute-binding s, 3 family protein [Burkholderia ambifaria AMMD]|uniref:Amino acid ABC transporter substrate-binding protein, PAAT family n=1 Tax=Burkholderia ambifaria (strain ATCC BAA-244 / DSM 16087 / CCUG 44356 / LMG 19182 / AMMD) TaxID=339670 RepID=Q0B8H9_BURCM|nr:ABC transporter substrate-binding protein [Burkholderia ambifaria]ABI89544.1 amino acid ABC transporter substrate-binding protein, PAAT family [Burkholderia ambifaria AMMD]AJY25746.1 bacterial extracellular solute-binding s, 3 family protein [Burkholderia ambifaria AMMD]MBR7930085.1 ABC transporter substrate-binding protein [Burkholderia ambifaria]PEH67669.1 amino acid ABC transporter substrate-binding protein [Burkholderia ambifaria]QQC07794.1 ABC transporter substrate-binding protein [Bur